MSGKREYISLLLKTIGHKESCVLTLTARMIGKCIEVHGVFGEPKLFLLRRRISKKNLKSRRKKKKKEGRSRRKRRRRRRGRGKGRGGRGRRERRRRRRSRQCQMLQKNKDE